MTISARFDEVLDLKGTSIKHGLLLCLLASSDFAELTCSGANQLPQIGAVVKGEARNGNND